MELFIEAWPKSLSVIQADTSTTIPNFQRNAVISSLSSFEQCFKPSFRVETHHVSYEWQGFDVQARSAKGPSDALL